VSEKRVEAIVCDISVFLNGKNGIFFLLFAFNFKEIHRWNDDDNEMIFVYDNE